MDICPVGITQVMSCDGTATSERWCCGSSTNCCFTNIGVVTLKQVFNGASTSSIGSVPTPIATHQPTSASETAEMTSLAYTYTARPASRNVAGGIIAGVVTGAIFGLFALLAVLFMARRKVRNRATMEKKTNDYPLLAEACALSQRHELSPSARKSLAQELPGTAPTELEGDVARR